MLEADVGVTLAMLLSLASMVLCVGWGWSRWNADDDEGAPSDQRDDPSPSGGGT